MILVDSSVWIDYFRGIDTWHTAYLERTFSEPGHQAGTADLVVAEVLQGFRTEKQARDAEDLFALLAIVHIGGREFAFQAARNYRRLRAKGITVRSTIDCLIATYCVAEQIPLLHDDRDFDAFAVHLGLRTVQP